MGKGGRRGPSSKASGERGGRQGEGRVSPRPENQTWPMSVAYTQSDSREGSTGLGGAEYDVCDWLVVVETPAGERCSVA